MDDPRDGPDRVVRRRVRDDRQVTDDEPLLRRAGPADADPIRDLVHRAYRDYEPLLGRTPLPMLTDFDAAIRDREVWVLEGSAGIVGVLELEPRADHVWIDDVAVDPEAQGRGLGRRLLDHAEAETRRLNLAELRLLTNERYERNIAIYTARGYVETHREPYRGTDLVHFRKRLG